MNKGEIKDKIKTAWAYHLIYLEWGVWYLEKVKYLLAMAGLNIAINYPLWVMILIGGVGYMTLVGLGALHFKAHIPEVMEKISVKYMTYYAKRNYSIQEKILDELKKIGGKL